MSRPIATSIQAQIALLTIALSITVMLISSLSEYVIPDRNRNEIAIGVFAGRIQQVSEDFDSSTSQAEQDFILSKAIVSGIQVERLGSEIAGKVPVTINAIPRAVFDLLDKNPLGRILNSLRRSASRTVTVETHSGQLSFLMPSSFDDFGMLATIAGGLGLILIPAGVLGFISAWLIGRPLVRFAAAAERASMEDGLEEPFVAEGAIEIRSLAASLNTMRRRVLDLASQRTRMLTSISHDLRTPLTRLRMRAERSEPPELRQKMLNDIEVLSSMIDESLAYLSNTLETNRKVELASLLQTIADDFSDTGIPVNFSGPRRLIYECKPRSISRAVSNLIENASRHATMIDLSLEKREDGTVVIAVSDDGPGLSDKLKKLVMEPFFKADEARPIGGGAGFGLGLPITHGIVTRGHGGTLELRDRVPEGLRVIISLPAVPRDGVPDRYL